ncbi:hypothetical protein [Providencia huaxiensis]|uniref:hypothetical protein n=1 Tax=Providencia huaxiensis TaxID=2027290 RepID=UPI0034DD6B94
MKLYFGLILPLLLFFIFLMGKTGPVLFVDSLIRILSKFLLSMFFHLLNMKGIAIFNPRFVENKKGCEANFRILPMRMSWPDLNPFSEVSHDVKMIEVYVEPLNGDPEKYLSYRKHVYLDMGYLKRKGELYYDEELEYLFY